MAERPVVEIWILNKLSKATRDTPTSAYARELRPSLAVSSYLVVQLGFILLNGKTRRLPSTFLARPTFSPIDSHGITLWQLDWNRMICRLENRVHFNDTVHALKYCISTGYYSLQKKQFSVHAYETEVEGKEYEDGNKDKVAEEQGSVNM